MVHTASSESGYLQVSSFYIRHPYTKKHGPIRAIINHRPTFEGPQNQITNTLFRTIFNTTGVHATNATSSNFQSNICMPVANFCDCIHVHDQMQARWAMSKVKRFLTTFIILEL